MLRRLLALLATAIGMIVTVAVASTTTVSAASYVYDAPAPARAAAHTSEPSGAGPRSLGGVREWSASRSVEARGTSATPSALSNATEAASGAGDHIVLGLRDYGLEETAAKVGGRTLLSDPEWQSTLVRSIGDPGTRFTVSLDGLSGSSTYSQVMSAVQNGATPLASATNWELAQLYQAGRLGDVTFVSGGSVVVNPWAP